MRVKIIVIIAIIFLIVFALILHVSASNTTNSILPNESVDKQFLDSTVIPLSPHDDGFALDASELLESLYVVKVDRSTQRVYVYCDGKEIRRFVCSTGTPDNETPTGRFVINESGQKRGEWFYSERYGAGARYWIGFIGGEYLFHSVPMDRDKNIIKKEEALLGQPASHGCIRLSVDDAFWFYSNVPSGSVLYISGITPANLKPTLPEADAAMSFEEQFSVLEDSLFYKEEVTTWLFSHEHEYFQQHLLSCEAALMRMVLAIMGISDLDEDSILDSLPKGNDPETTFVCDNIDEGRRNADGSIHWNNYGAHPPVVVEGLHSYMKQYHLITAYTVCEMMLTDAELKELIVGDKRFLGAIVWLVGHPERWGNHPDVNERGMVAGEHVRFVNPELDEKGCFMVWDPESHPNQPSHLSSIQTRDMFGYRAVAIFRKSG